MYNTDIAYFKLGLWFVLLQLVMKFKFQIGIKEFAKQFHYNSEILKTFPILHHHMSDIELTTQNYFVGPKTEDRICSHTIAIFKMLNGIIIEVNELSLKLQKILFSTDCPTNS